MRKLVIYLFFTAAEEPLNHCKKLKVSILHLKLILAVEYSYSLTFLTSEMVDIHDDITIASAYTMCRRNVPHLCKNKQTQTIGTCTMSPLEPRSNFLCPIPVRAHNKASSQQQHTTSLIKR